MGFIGPTALGVLAQITTDGAERQQALAEARPCWRRAASATTISTSTPARRRQPGLRDFATVERYCLGLERYTAAGRYPERSRTPRAPAGALRARRNRRSWQQPCTLPANAQLGFNVGCRPSMRQWRNSAAQSRSGSGGSTRRAPAAPISNASPRPVSQSESTQRPVPVPVESVGPGRCVAGSGACNCSQSAPAGSRRGWRVMAAVLPCMASALRRRGFHPARRSASGRAGNPPAIYGRAPCGGILVGGRRYTVSPCISGGAPPAPTLLSANR